MPYHIKKPFPLEPANTLYYQGGTRWTDTYSKRKTYVNKGTADNRVDNSSGKNGGFKGSTIVEE